MVGLYGTWGIGKTSLTARIRRKLGAEDVPTVWFDPWRHHFDGDPDERPPHEVTIARPFTIGR